MFSQLFLLFHFAVLVLAADFNFDHFINPPANPKTDSSTDFDVVKFTEGTTERLRWLTTFKTSSLALLPAGADPLASKSTAAFITRNFSGGSVQWSVGPPPGLQPGVYVLQLYQEGGPGTFPSHNFTINASASSTSKSTITSTSTASQRSASTGTTTPAAITSSTASAYSSSPTAPLAASPLNFPSSTASLVASPLNVPAVAETSSSSSAISESSSSVPTTSTASLISVSQSSSALTSPTTSGSSSSVPATITSTASLISQSSSSLISSSLTSPTSPTSTFNTAPAPPALTDAQQITMSKQFSEPEKLAVIVVPIFVAVVAAMAFLAYRHLTRRRGVEAMMAKSLKVKEMPVGDGISSQWRDSEGHDPVHSPRSWQGDDWRKLPWWKRG